ncbi:MAG: hypothetical protein LC136_09190 [Burkholderiales bacterium]|nr:hypothetical protein [Gemmatimonadaceae bacterium]MCZ2414412.1 hypothetical protein [Burkholderiales bacterium]
MPSYESQFALGALVWLKSEQGTNVQKVRITDIIFSANDDGAEPSYAVQWWDSSQAELRDEVVLAGQLGVIT